MINTKDYESNGRPKVGFISGLHHDIGKYELCLSIEATIDQKEAFDSKFCLISIFNPYTEASKKESDYREASQTLRNQFVRDQIEFR